MFLLLFHLFCSSVAQKRNFTKISRALLWSLCSNLNMRDVVCGMQLYMSIRNRFNQSIETLRLDLNCNFIQRCEGPSDFALPFLASMTAEMPISVCFRQTAGPYGRSGSSRQQKDHHPPQFALSEHSSTCYLQVSERSPGLNVGRTRGPTKDPFW